MLQRGHLGETKKRDADESKLKFKTFARKNNGNVAASENDILFLSIEYSERPKEVEDTTTFNQ